MVAIVSGNTFGLLNASNSLLAAVGLGGNAFSGRAREASYLNIATGNLSVQRQDDFIAASGLDTSMLRTYNSQGQFEDGQGAQWKVGLIRQVTQLSGEANTAGSTVYRIDGSGSGATFTYDQERGLYVSTAGEGRYQTLELDQTQWTWRDQAGQSESFDALQSGRITAASDGEGGSLQFFYGADGNVSHVQNANGDQTHFDYDAAGNIAHYRTVAAGTGAESIRVRYRYDELNRLVLIMTDLSPADNSISDGNIYTTAYTYVGNSNRIATSVQKDGTRLEFNYELAGAVYKLRSLLENGVATATFDYSVAGQTTVTDRFGAQTVYGFDDAGQLTSVSGPMVNGVSVQRSYQYDGKGNVAVISGGGIATVHYEYDQYGNCVLERDSAGNPLAVRDFSADGRRLLGETRFDANGAPALTSYVYDGSARLRFVVEPQGAVKEIRYNAAGLRSAVLDYSASDIDTRALLATFASDAGPLVLPAQAALVDGKLQLTSTNQLDPVTPVITEAPRSLGSSWRFELQTPAVITDQLFTSGIDAGTWGESDARRLRISMGPAGIGAQLGTGTAMRYEHLGAALPNTTYIVEFTTDSSGKATVWVYAKGGDRASGYAISQQFGAVAAVAFSAGTYCGPAAGDGTAGSTASVALDNLLIRSPLSEATMLAWVQNPAAPRGVVTRTDYTYDVRALLDSVTSYASVDAAGGGVGPSTVRYVYDQAGQMLQFVDAQQQATSFTYDGLNRVLTTSTAAGQASVTVYDDARNSSVTTLSAGWSATSLYAASGALLFGDDYANRIVDSSSGADDVFDGGKGNDSFSGGAGNDTFVFGRGDGQDVIESGLAAGAPGQVNTLRFKAGITAADLVFTRSGLDLVVAISGSTDKVTIGAFYFGENPAANTFNPVQQLAFDDGATIDLAGLIALAPAAGVSGNSLNGTAGIDTLTGAAGNDLLAGLDGADVLQGLAGDDTLVGGAGDDSLTGEAGSDTYVVARGDGIDRILESGSNSLGDTLQFLDVASSDLRYVTRRANDLVVGYGLADELTIDRHFETAYSVEQIKFSDGVMWDPATSFGKVIMRGTAGNDTINSPGTFGYRLEGIGGNDVLNGLGGADTLVGGTGNDQLFGQAGNDTYIFSVGDGLDRISEADASAIYTDTIQLQNVASTEMRSMLRRGNDLVLAYGVTDEITVVNHFIAANKIDQIKFSDGVIWNDAAIRSRIVFTGTAGSDTMTADDAQANRMAGLAGDDTMTGGAVADTIDGGSGNDTLTGAAGNDTLRGEDGNDRLTGDAGLDLLVGGRGDDGLIGSEGNDTYVFSKGDGVDWIFDLDSAAGNSDTIRFTDVTSTELRSFERNDKALVIHYGIADKITVIGFYDAAYGNTYKIEKMEFSDGVVWNSAAINAMVVTYDRAGLNLITGYGDNSNRIFGVEGDDTLTGAGYGDLLDGGLGNDRLEGLAGDDHLYGQEGVDTLVGGAGADRLIGGLGDDTLEGNDGRDTYVFSVGDGFDSIFDYDATAGNFDTIEFTDVPSTALRAFERNNNTLVIRYGLSDTIHVRGFYDAAYGSNYRIEQIKFSDGVIWNAADIMAKVMTYDRFVLNNVTGYSDGENRIFGLEGNDTLTGAAFNDTLDGGVDNDTLNGGSGDDKLFGQVGNDALYGGAGGDMMSGGTGNDYLVGEAGGDVYEFSVGDGSDIVSDWDGQAGIIDTIRFTDVSSVQLRSFERNDTNLVIAYGIADTVTIRNYFFSSNGATGKVERIQFSDGVIWGNAEIHANVLTVDRGGINVVEAYADGENRIYGLEGNDTLRGSAYNDTLDGGVGSDSLFGNNGNDTVLGQSGNDTIEGNAGNDVLTGGTGDDLLIGGSQNDVYAFAVGDGADTIVDWDSATGTSDTILFSDVASTQLRTFERNGNNLVIAYGATDKITVHDYFYSSNGAYGKVERIQFSDGVVWTNADINARVLTFDHAGLNVVDGYTDGGNRIYGLAGDDTLRGAGFADMLDGGVGNDRLEGNAGNDTLWGADGNDALLGSYGNDMLVGGLGNDTLDGGNQDDTYVFSVGDGVDTIFDWDSLTGNLDTVILHDVASNQLRAFERNDNHLVIDYGVSDRITIRDYFYSSNGATGKVERIQFSDGVVWNTADIHAKVLTYDRSGANVVYGYLEGDNRIFGLAGDDTLNGVDNRNDILDGGIGNDRLYGFSGNDTLLGQAGNDTLDGQYGSDTLIGGQGNDFLSGGAHSDTFVFSVGDGVDTISDWDSATGNVDAIVFTDVASTQLRAFERNGNSLVLAYGITDKLTIHDYFYSSNGANGKVERLQFSDGVVWLHAQIIAKVLTYDRANVNRIDGYEDGENRIFGLLGNDTLKGAGFNDSLEGGVGDDWLEGRAGNDTYRFATGDGVDTISDFDSTLGNMDTIELTDVASTDLRAFERSNDDLVIYYGVADSITVRNHFNASHSYYSKVERLSFSDGVVWDLSKVAAGMGTYDRGGSDNITGTADGPNRIFGLGGNDYLIGAGFGDEIDGGIGNDFVGGLGGDDKLFGGDGDDVMYGDDGDDVLIGGKGNDAILGNDGNDTFIYSLGDGVDRMREGASASGNVDKVQFLDVQSKDVRGYLRVGNDFVINYGVSDQLTIRDQFNGGVVEQIMFADGVILEADDIAELARTLVGTAGADTLTATALSSRLQGQGGNDVLTFNGDADYTVEGGAGDDRIEGVALQSTRSNILAGGKGNDLLIGGVGAESYLVNRGDGHDTIRDDGGTAGKLDRVVFGPGIGIADLSFSRMGDHLVVQVRPLPGSAAPSDQITIENWFLASSSGSFQIEAFDFQDGTTLDKTELTRAGNVLKGTAVADTITAAAASQHILCYDGNDTVSFGTAASYVIDGGAGDDAIEVATQTATTGSAHTNTLKGGKGNDTLTSGNSADTYIYSRGDGADTISDFDSNGAQTFDQLVFGAGITVGDLTLSRVGDDLLVVIADQANPSANDRVTVVKWFSPADSGKYQIETFAFDDGRILTNAQISVFDTLASSGVNGATSGTAGADLLTGGHGSDTIDGGAGNDTMTDIGTGRNNLIGGAGDDTITTSVLSASNTIQGGLGRDIIASGASADTYLFGRGDGADLITDLDASGGPGMDKVVFGTGITAADLIVDELGANLRLTLRAANGAASLDSITFLNWFSDSAYRIETFEFADGATLTFDQVQQLAVRQRGDLGLENMAPGALAQIGAGAGAIGQAGLSLTLNTQSGNLVLQDHDDLLASSGLDLSLARTYNSQAVSTSPWQLSLSRSVRAVNGTLVRDNGDGSQGTYVLQGDVYVSTEGQGAYHRITADTTAGTWTWTSGNGAVTETYDAAQGGRLRSLRDIKGNVTTLAYTDGGQVARMTGATGESMVFVYDPASKNLLSVRSEYQLAGQTVTSTKVRYSYDELNRLVKVVIDLSEDISAVGSEVTEAAALADGKLYWTTYKYLRNTNLITNVEQTDGSDLELSYIQDIDSRQWRLVSATDGQQRTTQLIKHATGNTIRDASGHEVRYVYDALGQLDSVTDLTALQTTRYTYDAQGNIATVTDPRNVVTTFAYDAQGQQVSQRIAGVQTVERTFGALPGQVLTETVFAAPGAGASPQTTRFVHDAQGRQRFQISAEGRVTEYRYDNPRSEQSHVLRYSGQTFDLAGFDANTAPTLAQLESWLAGIDRLQATLTRYEFDLRGLLARTLSYESVDASGNGVGTPSVQQSVYDQWGQLVQTIDANGAQTNYAYDGLGRLLSTSGTSTDGTLAFANVTMSYNDVTRTTVSTRAGVTTTTLTDRTGQVLKSTSSTIDGAGTTRYAYDANGLLRMTIGPTGQRAFFIYDAAGRKVADIDNDFSVVEYSYNASNQVSRTRHYALATTATLVDAALNPLVLTMDQVRPVATPLRDRTSWNIYDQAGRLLDTVDAKGAVTHYDYDGASRLVAVTQRGTLIDLAPLASLTAPASIVQQASVDDRITRYFHDRDGNQIAVLDAEGNLAESRYNAAGQLVETMTYQQLSKAAARASGTLDALRPDDLTVVSSVHYLYNAKSQMVATVDGAGFLTETSYDAKGNVAATRRYATPVLTTQGATLASLRPDASEADRLTTYEYTALNQLRKEIRPGGIVTSYQYNPLGNVTASTVSYGDGATGGRNIYDTRGYLVGELPADVAATLTGSETQKQLKDLAKAKGMTHRYDDAGLRISSTDQFGNRTRYFYDADARLTATVNALGEVQAQFYNKFNQLESTRTYATNFTGATLSTLIGGRNIAAFNTLLGSMKSAADSVQTYDYDVRGQLVDQTDALGNHALMSYDAFGAATTLTQLGTAASAARNGAVDVELRTLYDNNGRAFATVSSGGTLSVSRFDAAGRVIEQVVYARPVATAITAAQVRAGIEAGTFADPASDQRQRFCYDARGLLSATLTATHAAGGQQQWSLTTSQYDSNGNLTVSIAYATALAGANPDAAQIAAAARSASDGETRYAYDQAGRVSVTASAQSAGSGAARYWTLSKQEYDSNGNVAVSRVLATQLFGAEPTQAELIAAADAAQYSTADAVVRYAYDGANRVIGTATAQRSDAGVLQWSVTSNVYDKGGRLQSSVQRANFLSTDPTAAASAAEWMAGVVASESGDRTTTYGYDVLHRVVQVANPGGIVDKVVYDSKGNVVNRMTFTNAAATTAHQTTRTVYDLNNRPVLEIDALGGVTLTRYDALGNISETIRYADPLSQTDRVAVDVLAKLDNANPQNRVERYVYDQAGRLRFRVDGARNLTESRYDALGRVVHTLAYQTPLAAGDITAQLLAGHVAAHEALARASSAAYDGQGDVVSSTDGMGKTEHFVYDARGQKIAHTNALANTWTYEYDSAGHLVLERSPQVESADAAGNVATVALETRTTYDALGNVKSRTEASGVAGYERITSYEYDLMGRQVATILPPAEVFDPVNADGNLSTAQVTSTARVMRVEYDAVGNAIRRTDVRGNVSHTVYDRLGRARYEIDARGAVTARVFDSFGNVTSETRYAKVLDGMQSASGLTEAGVAALLLALGEEGARKVTNYYDVQSKVVATIGPEGALTTFAYNGFGEVSLQTRHATLITAAARAALPGGCLTSVVSATLAAYANSTTDIRQVQRYDQNGRVVWSVDGTGATTKMDYDASGNLTGRVTYAQALDSTAMAALAADPDAVPVPVAGPDAVTTSYRYDGNNRLLSSTDAEGGVTETRYNDIGQVEETIARAAIAANDAHTYQRFDKLGRTTLSIDAAGMATRFVYDALGNVASTTRYAQTMDAADAQPVAGAQDRTSYFVYDSAGRTRFTIDPLGLVQETRYDALGQVTQTRQYDATLKLAAPMASADVAVAAQNTPARVNSFVYDLQGNLLSSTDGLNHTESNQYDALGNRIAFINKKGDVWNYQYDTAGRLTLETAPSAKVSTINPTGFIVVEVDGVKINLPVDKVTGADIRLMTRTEYDSFGNVRARTEAANVSDMSRTTRYEYDLAGRQTVTRLPQAQVYNGTDLATTARGDVTVDPVVRVTYDTLGNAVKNQDAAGFVSRKVYDKRGLVAFEIDAKGQVTGYTHDAFGKVASLTRYAQAITPPDQLTDADWTRDAVAARVSALDHAADRTVATRYDRAGREVEVVESASFVYEVLAANPHSTLSKVTATEYNAFGEVRRVRMFGGLAGADGQPASMLAAGSELRRYYNARGEQVAEFVLANTAESLQASGASIVEMGADVGGYLTTTQYDEAGNVTSVTEHAAVMAAIGFGDDSYAAGIASDGDRTTVSIFDDANRKVSETRVDSLADNADGSRNATLRQLTTVYAYDKVGNQISTTDVIGGIAYTYFDALGRITMVAARGSEAGGYKVTRFERDAHGNVIRQSDYASRVATAGPDTAPTIPAGSARVTLTAYDRNGRALSVTDAMGHTSHASYDVFGREVRKWQEVTGIRQDQFGGATNESQVSYTVTKYDAVGNIVEVVTPGSFAAVSSPFMQASIVKSAIQQVFVWSGSNEVKIDYPDVGNKRVRVDLTYLSHVDYFRIWDDDTGWDVNKRSARTLSVSQTFDSAPLGATLKWESTEATPAGIASISLVSVYVDDGAGGWVLSMQRTGAQLSTVEVVNTQLKSIGTNNQQTQFNSFGEAIARSHNGVQYEYAEYNHAGQVWRTNVGDGVDKVMYYNVAGQMTAMLRSKKPDLAGDASNPLYRSAQQVYEAISNDADTVRTETRYDLMGRELLQVGAAQTVRKETGAMGIPSASVSYGATTHEGITAGVTVNFSALQAFAVAGLTQPEVRVTVRYDVYEYEQGATEPNSGSSGSTWRLSHPEATHRTLTPAEVAAGSARITWSAASSNANSVQLSVKDLNGKWHIVADTVATAQAGPYLKVKVDLPPLADALYINGAGTPVDAMARLGDALLFDASPFGAGAHQIEILSKDVSGGLRAVATVQFVVHVAANGVKTLSDVSTATASVVTLEKPKTYRRYDRWSNVVALSVLQGDARWVPVHVDQYAYNDANQVLERSSRYAYGGTTLKTVAMGSNYYDAVGRQIAIRDAEGNLTRHVYDKDGHLSDEIRADDGVLRSEYNVFGDRTRQTLSGKGVVLSEYRYTFDDLGHLKSVTQVTTDKSDPEFADVYVGSTTETYTYDELGRRTTSTNLAGTTQMGYDLAGNVISLKGTDNMVSLTTYDAFKHKTSYLDANGKRVGWNVDPFGRVDSSIDLGQVVTRFRYNGLGQVEHQGSGAHGPVAGQDLSFTYEADRVVRIVDAATQTTTSYEYDLAGNRVREHTVTAGVVTQNNFLVYDAQQRLVHVADGRFDVRFEYDNNGNRTRVQTWYAINDGRETYVDARNTFDKMNRSVILNGEYANGQVVIGSRGHLLTHDEAGRRTSDQYVYTREAGGEYTAHEKHFYDGLGRLTSVLRGDVTSAGTSFIEVDSRRYDEKGRLKQEGVVQHADTLKQYGIEARTRVYTYNAEGRMETVTIRDANAEVIQVVDYRDTARPTGGYDRVGNVVKYTVTADGRTMTYEQEYLLMATYKHHWTSVRADLTSWTTPMTIDANGNVVAVLERTIQNNVVVPVERTMQYDAAGHVLRKSEGGKLTYALVANGEMLGMNHEGVGYEDGFADVYQAATSSNFFAVPSSYVVDRDGETPSAIAQMMWGNSSLWYLIADANGLQGNVALSKGQMLTIPAQANTTSSSHSTFKPYNARAIVGDTTPIAPPPPASQQGCGIIGQIMLVVIAIVVSYITQGLIPPDVPYALVMAASAAAGSVASQSVAVWVGAQEKFDWKSVAISALSAGLGEGLKRGAEVLEFAKLAGQHFAAVAARAAITSAISQRIAVMTGLQDKFSWRSVAAAGVSSGLNRLIMTGVEDRGIKSFAGTVAGSTIANFSGGVAAQLIGGGKMEFRKIAADSFGNALGQGLASAIGDSLTPSRAENVKPELRPVNDSDALKIPGGPAGGDVDEKVGTKRLKSANSAAGTSEASASLKTESQRPIFDVEKVGYTDSQQRLINDALDSHEVNLNRKLEEVTKWDARAKSNFSDAFETTDESARGMIKDRLERQLALNKTMTVENFREADRGERSAGQWATLSAYVYRDDPDHKIYLGPLFWARANSHDSSNPAWEILAHEMSHFSGTSSPMPGSIPAVTGTIDGVIDPRTGREALDETGRKRLSIYGRIESTYKLATSSTMRLYHADTFSYYVNGTAVKYNPSSKLADFIKPILFP